MRASALLVTTTQILVLRELLRRRQLRRERERQQQQQQQQQQQPQRRRIRPRRWYLRPWVKERENYGHFHQLMPVLRTTDPDTYRKYLRVNHALFEQILGRIKPRIQRQDTNWKKALEPGLRLAITLRFLATGELKHLLISYY